MSIKVFLSLFFLSLVACTGSNPSAKTAKAKTSQIQGKVYFEQFDHHGEFSKALVLDDPYKKSYGQRQLKLNKVYPMETIGKGPANKKINIVLVGDGYTQSELPSYRQHTQRLIDQFFAEAALKDYRDFFVFHRIDVVSPNSGIRSFNADLGTEDLARPPSPLGMIRNCNNINRLLCADVEKVMLIANQAPKVDMVFAFANTNLHGGAGYREPPIGTLAGGHWQSYDTAMHEFGHAFAKLGDEYDYPGADTATCLEKPNASIFDARDMQDMKLKWHNWLDLPNVASFNGTCYTRDNYRPTRTSAMRNLGQPFYEVNSEQIVFNIHKNSNLLLSHTPQGTYGSGGWLYVRAIQTTHLKIDWYLNGKKQSQWQNFINVNMDDWKLRSGTNEIQAVIQDKTPRVRDENFRSENMTKKLNWTIIHR